MDLAVERALLLRHVLDLLALFVQQGFLLLKTQPQRVHLRDNMVNQSKMKLKNKLLGL